MNKLLIACRYFVFVLFIVCSVIICSVSAWNLTFTQAIGLNYSVQVDAFLIAVSALGLLFIFPIMFIDILRKDTLIRQVRFECLWVGIFWILELSGAVAVTASKPDIVCIAQGSEMSLNPCTSMKVLLAFTWIATVNLLIYFCALAVIAIIHYHEDPLVWKSSTLDYAWFTIRTSLGNSPPSSKQTWHKRFFMSASQPRRQTEFSKRMIAGNESDLEKQVQPEEIPTVAGRGPPPAQQILIDSSMLQHQDSSLRTAASEPPQHLSPNVVPFLTTASADTGGTPRENIRIVSPATPPSPACYVQSPRKAKRSLKMHRPPPLDLSRASVYR
ncbi:hypothetical protein AcW1_005798 [Taiwanofungus camphoratus]|nr:hypothetical protein AcW2_004558 [Antrodia cinnamomea]KAI0934193.1 hypothetical protein AcV5_006122 [Antrodia cinnamomea]KAI0934194.1 hypothetical protein AcV5_006122 [Antrodia cinnamomea]KAI0957391.1 hypothetical protein AcW1_005798 [Antrodia cinnamomea]